MTTKKELDKMLSRLQKMQRECFKKGSKTRLQVDPLYDEERDDFEIRVTAYNTNVVRRTKDGMVYNFDCFYIYSWREVDVNEEEMKRIVDFLTFGNGQR